jgi:amidophosphoribosyltransferase
MNSLREACGVFGVFGQTDGNAALTTYYGLYALQHRGQESCGIVVNDDGLFRARKDLGLVSEVITPRVLTDLGPGSMAVGHVRYSTTGGNDRVNAQPILVNHRKGRLALAHNGNLTNAYQLREELEMAGTVFHTTTDTELISCLVIRERIHCGSIEEAVSLAMEKLHGAFSLCIMSPSKLIAVRDEHGFRPLCYGQTADGTYIVASETCALDAVGARFIREVEPGEIVVFSRSGVRSLREHCGKAKPSLCVFEYIYFARPDSVLDGISVNEARLRAGAFLALEHPVQADIVIGVPDSGIDAAIGYARQSGIPYGIGLIKNKYIGRTFISPVASARADMVKIKLNPIASAIRDKRVVLVDDSIVRGTTSRRLVGLIRDAGAKEVHMRVSSPPFLNSCYYGTDIDSRGDLIACRASVPEIAREIGADSLGYLSVNDVALLAHGESGGGYCTGCFSGKYPTELPTVAKKNRFEQKIGTDGCADPGGDENND